MHAETAVLSTLIRLDNPAATPDNLDPDVLQRVKKVSEMPDGDLELRQGQAVNALLEPLFASFSGPAQKQ